MTESNFQIVAAHIGDREAIETRVAEVDEVERSDFRLALSYLYLKDGPVSIPRKRKSAAELHLSPVELFVFQWLYKRTDGKLKRLYGPAVLETVKRSRYRCEKCNFPDVRALNLEKSSVEKESKKIQFACLCANCNTIIAREKEMLALSYERERVAKLAAEKAAAEKAEAERAATAKSDESATKTNAAIENQAATDVAQAFQHIAMKVADASSVQNGDDESIPTSDAS